MMGFERSVVASKATAERQFVVGRGHPDKATNIISEVDFQGLLKLDKTPTKKYIHAICRWLVMPEIDFITGKDRRAATYNYWELPKDGKLHYKVIVGPTISLLVKLYHLVTTRGVLVTFDRDALERVFIDYEGAQARKLPVRDPNSFFSIEEFIDHLDNLDDKYHFRDAAKLKEGLKVLYDEYHARRRYFELFKDNSDFLVLGLLDFSATNSVMNEYMGEKPHWCVARQESYWEEYRDERDCSFYWVVSKKGYRQCWMVQVPGYESNERFTIWDWQDTPISVTETNKLLAHLEVEKADFEALDVPGKREKRRVGVVFIQDTYLNLRFEEGFEVEASDLEPGLYSEFMDRAKTFVDESDRDGSYDYDEILVGTEEEDGSYNSFLTENGLDDSFDTVEEVDPQEYAPGFDAFVYGYWTNIVKSKLFVGGDILLEVSPAWLAARGVSWPTNFSEDNYRDYERALEGWFRKYHVPVKVTIHTVYGQVYVDWSFYDVDTPFEEKAIDTMNNSYLLALLHLKLLLHMHPELSVHEVHKMVSKKTSSQDPDTSMSLEKDMVDFTNTWLDRYYR